MTRALIFTAGVAIGVTLTYGVRAAIFGWISRDLDRAGIGYLDGSDA